jgi:hypothetical protein
MPEQPRVTSIRETMGLDSKNMPTAWVTAVFYLGDNGPFTVQIPKKEFTGLLLRDRIAQYAREVSQVAG